MTVWLSSQAQFLIGWCYKQTVQPESNSSQDTKEARTLEVVIGRLGAIDWDTLGLNLEEVKEGGETRRSGKDPELQG